MKYKGTLIAVKDCKKAFRFYHELFGLDLIRDNDGNMELSDIMYLQEERYWKSFLEKEVITASNSTELYFEERYPETEYANKQMTHSWGQIETERLLLRKWDLCIITHVTMWKFLC